MRTIDALTLMATEAGAAIQQVRASGLGMESKPGGEILTSADLASHELIITRFRQYFPGVPTVTEESQKHQIPSAPFLVADELDGTAPFIAGSEHWGVMIALVDGSPTHGVIHLPDLAVTITATQGSGCWLNGRNVNLRSNLHLSDALLGSEINKFLLPRDWKLLRHISTSARAVRCTASTAASAYELISGRTAAYINIRGGKIWDFAAPALAISEAGGHTCTPDGAEIDWNMVDMSFLAGASASLLEEWLETYRHTQLPGNGD